VFSSRRDINALAKDPCFSISIEIPSAMRSKIERSEMNEREKRVSQTASGAFYRQPVSDIRTAR